MTFTIEPGIYLAGIGGVRVEDDILATKDGCRVLTNTSKDLREPHIKSIDTARRSGDEIHNEGITLKRWWHTLQQRQSCATLSHTKPQYAPSQAENVPTVL